ncbi:MAG: type VI secretion system protein TssA [Alphaproteobacteria bacterium]|nr:type VI secretion system protein TssA [Alphaproteobacteria bacterium]
MDDLGHDLELALLLAPIPGDLPVGIDLRKDFSPQSPYYRLRDARAEAREMERRLDNNDPDAKGEPSTQWRAVRDIALKALTEQTKDLEIAAWLAEALVRQDGFAGLTVGIGLLAGLVEGFWSSDLYPMPDEDGVVTRVAPITGLNGEGGDGTLMQPIRKQVLFEAPDLGPVSYWQYNQSVELQKITEPPRREARLKAGVVPLDDLQKAARAVPAAHFAGLRARVKAALAAWARMSERLDAEAGREAPPTSRVRDILQDILEIANQYAPPETDEPVEQATEAEAVPDGETAPSTVPAASARAITREDMLKELGRIADYFRRTEPHSPLAYTLEEAVRRGRLTWPELLAEVVPDDGARSAILVMLGIRPPQPPPS